MRERVRELSNRARYCTMVHDGTLSVVKKKVAERISDLEAAGAFRICVALCVVMYVAGQ